jgi:hypothetical protein
MHIHKHTHATHAQPAHALTRLRAQVLHYRTLIDSLPGHIATLDTQHGGWQMMLIALEWQTGEAGLTLFPLTCGVRPKDALYVGLVINRGWAKLLPALDPIVDMQVKRRHPSRVGRPSMF